MKKTVRAETGRPKVAVWFETSHKYMQQGIPQIIVGTERLKSLIEKAKADGSRNIGIAITAGELNTISMGKINQELYRSLLDKQREDAEYHQLLNAAAHAKRIGLKVVPLLSTLGELKAHVRFSMLIKGVQNALDQRQSERIQGKEPTVEPVPKERLHELHAQEDENTAFILKQALKHSLDLLIIEKEKHGRKEVEQKLRKGLKELGYSHELINR